MSQHNTLREKKTQSLAECSSCKPHVMPILNSIPTSNINNPNCTELQTTPHHITTTPHIPPQTTSYQMVTDTLYYSGRGSVIIRLARVATNCNPSRGLTELTDPTARCVTQISLRHQHWKLNFSCLRSIYIYTLSITNTFN